MNTSLSEIRTRRPSVSSPARAVALALAWASGFVGLGVTDLSHGQDFDPEELKPALPERARLPEISGRLLMDAAFFEVDQTEMSNVTEVRSARIGVSGRIDAQWRYAIQYELTNEGSIKDAWLRYSSNNGVRWTFGQFQEPYGLEALTSSRYMTFIERALPNVFAPGYRLGAGFQQRQRQWTLSGGLFGERAEEVFTEEGNAGWGASGRFTLSPMNSGDRVLHFGVSGTTRQAASEQTLRFRARPETRLTDVRLVNTGRIRDVDYHSVLDMEAALVLGPLSLQGEFVNAWVLRDAGKDELAFTGSYVYVSYFLTGESRPYKSNATFGRIKPHSKEGAWEIAARLSHLDLNDLDIEGGEQTDYTLGVNYYFNPFMRAMFNAIYVDAERRNKAESPVLALLRLQVDF